jgi:hypothetical protein
MTVAATVEISESKCPLRWSEEWNQYFLDVGDSVPLHDGKRLPLPLTIAIV